MKNYDIVILIVGSLVAATIIFWEIVRAVKIQKGTIFPWFYYFDAYKALYSIGIIIAMISYTCFWPIQTGYAYGYFICAIIVCLLGKFGKKIDTYLYS